LKISENSAKKSLSWKTDAQYRVRPSNDGKSNRAGKKGRFTTSPNPNVGCVIAKNGEIVGEGLHFKAGEPNADVQAYRAQSCAIVSTSKTVIDDNASLNVRWSELPESTQVIYPESELRPPVRVILDRQQKLHQNVSLFQTSGNIEVVDPKSPYFQLNSAGQVDIPHVFDKLAEKLGIQHIRVEAGATLAASLIEQDLVDELIVYLAPKLMGSDGRGLVHILGLTSMQQAIDLEINDVRMVGPDIRITAKVIKNT
jgi:diaminohydroxyphosphoribosylaminopyrimidine deaminase/5-amino-6-(5-phosphoribosylamino)uracil reductase